MHCDRMPEQGRANLIAGVRGLPPRSMFLPLDSLCESAKRLRVRKTPDTGGSLICLEVWGE